MYKQLVARNTDQPGDSCFFERNSQLPCPIAGTPAFEVICVINADIILHTEFDMMVVSYPVQK
jgi:hypothetical protein